MRIGINWIKKMKRPTMCAAIYFFVLLPFFLIGAMEYRVDSEGMGFLPLYVLTTPWSWLLMPTWNFPIWGSGPLGTDVAIFVTCNIISGTANAYILFLLINWLEKRAGRISRSGE